MTCICCNTVDLRGRESVWTICESCYTDAVRHIDGGVRSSPAPAPRATVTIDTARHTAAVREAYRPDPPDLAGERERPTED